MQSISALSWKKCMIEDSPCQDAKLREAIRLFDAELVSLGYAARMAEMSRAEFMTALQHAQVPVLRTSLEEIEAEVDAFIQNQP